MFLSILWLKSYKGYPIVVVQKQVVIAINCNCAYKGYPIVVVQKLEEIKVPDLS